MTSRQLLLLTHFPPIGSSQTPGIEPAFTSFQADSLPSNTLNALQQPDLKFCFVSHLEGQLLGLNQVACFDFVSGSSLSERKIVSCASGRHEAGIHFSSLVVCDQAVAKSVCTGFSFCLRRMIVIFLLLGPWNHQRDYV